MRNFSYLLKPTRLLFALFFFATTLVFHSCSDSNESDIPKDEKPSDEQKWVFGVFKKDYLWAGDLPEVAPSGKNISALGPDGYFNRYMRYRTNSVADYKKDIYGDRFSDVKSTAVAKSGRIMFAEEDNNFGFGFIDIPVVNTINEVTQDTDEVLYTVIGGVVPGSPAAERGLKRGDVVRLINGVPTTTMGEYKNALNGSEIKLGIEYPVKRDITISKRSYADTPVLLDSIYEDLVPKTGYVVYNKFKAGDKDQFDNELKDVFRRFTQAGVSNVVVDLRYNGGGLISSAQLLASLLVDKEHLGQPYIYMEKKDSYNNKEGFAVNNFLDRKSMDNFNPGVDKVYIITTKYTASSSELVLHALKPYMGDRVIQVGEKTHGKNLGGWTVESKKYPWEINIITLRVYDRDKKSGYEEGISPKPQYTASEFYRIQNLDFLVVGDFGEIYLDPMLNRVMRDIYPGQVEDMFRRAKAQEIMNISRSTGEFSGIPVLSTFDPNELGLIEKRIIVD